MKFIGHVATRIINEVKGVNRVVHDVTSKPPARSSGSEGIENLGYSFKMLVEVQHMSKSHKRGQASHHGSKRYALRDSDTGRYIDVNIVRPKKSPTSVRLEAIKRVVRDSHAARKAK